MVSQTVEAEEEGDEDDGGEGRPEDFGFTILDFGFTILDCNLIPSQMWYYCCTFTTQPHVISRPQSLPCPTGMLREAKPKGREIPIGRQSLERWLAKLLVASDVYYARFMRGELGDALPFVKWAGRYELYFEAKQEFESRLTAAAA